MRKSLLGVLATGAALMACLAVDRPSGALAASGSQTHIRICTSLASGCDFTSLGEGLAAVPSGGVVTIAPGVYRQAGVLRASNVTLAADSGARIEGVAAEGKAALVIKGNDTVIEGVECSDIAVPDGNGSCVRLEGRNLTLRNVYFHDSEEGLLSGGQGGTVTIEDSRLERLGAKGRAHGLYVGGIERLVLRRSSVLSSRDEGHEVKSRAAHTLIEDSVIASLDGRDSRLVDVPNGGELVIRNSVLEEGPNSTNHDMIGFGLEGITYSDNSVTVDHGTMIIDRPLAHLVNGPVTPVWTDTRVIGGARENGAGITWFPDRKSAGLSPYPSLDDGKGAVSQGSDASSTRK